jgi:hypothetical protein
LAALWWGKTAADRIPCHPERSEGPFATPIKGYEGFRLSRHEHAMA